MTAFPSGTPPSERGGNIHTSGLLQLAEYLTMVDLYFTKYGRLAYNGGIVVPKKFTKGVYSFPLIHEVIGNNAEYIITLRHPLAMVQSVLDKSGGMPKGGIFNVRSAIERWALDDWLKWGVDEAVVNRWLYRRLPGYWKRYHYQIAMEAIPSHPSALWPRSHMMGAVKFYADFGMVEPGPSGGTQARLRRAGQPEGVPSCSGVPSSGSSGTRKPSRAYWSGTSRGVTPFALACASDLRRGCHRRSRIAGRSLTASSALRRSELAPNSVSKVCRPHGSPTRAVNPRPSQRES
jgi:hypothetical protein